MPCHGFYERTDKLLFHVQVAIALSLLVAEVTAAPFNDTVCTFSATPQLHTITRGTLCEQVSIDAYSLAHTISSLSGTNAKQCSDIPRNHAH